MDFEKIIKALNFKVTYPLLAKLPLEVSYTLASQLEWLTIGRTARMDCAYEEGIRRAYQPISERDMHCYRRCHRKMLSREILDTFHFSKMSESLSRCEGLDLLDTNSSGSGTILAMGHYGRPQLMAVIAGLHGKKIGMLTQPIDQRNPNLSNVERKYLNYKVKETLKISQGDWICVGDNMRPLYRSLLNGQTIAFLFDLYEPDLSNRFHSPFFDGTLCVSKGLLKIAKKTHSQILYGVVKDRGSGVEIEIRKLPEEPVDAMHAAISELEKDVKSEPWQWWQWNMLEHIWLPPSVEVNCSGL